MITTCRANQNRYATAYNEFSLLSSKTLIFAAALALAQMVQAGPTNFTWNVSSGNWSTPGNWTPSTSGAGPTSIDSATFNNTGASTSPTTVNNTVDLNFAIQNFTNNSAATSGSYVYPATQIPPGETLTISNQMIVGELNESVNTAATFQYMVGGGTLDIVGPNLIVQDYGSSGAGPCAFLNLSGLTNFIYNDTNGTIYAAGLRPGNYTSGSSGTRQAGSIILAAGSNYIRVGAINLGSAQTDQAGPTPPGSNPAGSVNTLTLGTGTNIINVGTLNVAAQKTAYNVVASGGGLRMRGITGADSDASDNITLGNRNVGNSSGSAFGQLLLNGCAVDIKANTLIVGENTGLTTTTSSYSGGGILQFDTGTVSANSMLMAYNISANNTNKIASVTGTLQVGANGTLLIGAGQAFALATSTSSGPSTGTLIVSNGLVNCQGPLTMGIGTNSIPPSSPGLATGIIQLISAGTLNMGPNSYIGSISNPVTTLILDTNSVLSLSIPSVSYTNICVSNLSWASPDTNLTIAVAAMPAGIVPGATFPFLNFSGTMTNSFNSPRMVLPPGVQGNLSLAPGANTMYLNITAGVGPGTGGINQLTNVDFQLDLLGAYWTATGGASVVNTNSTYPNTGTCSSDTRNVEGFFGVSPNVGVLTNSSTSGPSYNALGQSALVSPGSTFTAGGFAYVAHEDMMSGEDSFYYELDLLNTNGVLIAAYESTVISNLNCGEVSPFPLDTWNLLGTTNEMQVTGGVNTGVVVTNVASTFTVPPTSYTATLKAVLVQNSASDTGAVYVSQLNLGKLTDPVPPSISAVTPNLITLCTNTALTCTATSTVASISSVQIVATTTTLVGGVTNVTTYNQSSPGVTVTGLGTSSANISLALVPDTIYLSVVVKASDVNGQTVSSSPVNFDTLAPNLVIEASDFNYSSGQFIDTPPNGGLALYQGQVGAQGIDEFKITRTNTQSYYRPADATVIQVANPAAPSGTEQKFVTAAANGDATDVELVIGYDSVGDWQNYSRTVASSGESIQPGTYNVWAYLAVSGSGAQVGFYQVAGDPGAPGQSTNFIGNFGGSTFSDNSYNNFVYAPLVDQFGNRVTVTLTNGVETFRGQIINSDTPNVGFYTFVPAVPVLTPEFFYVYPTTTLEPTNAFTFIVGSAQGASSISTDSIGLVVNGVPVTSGVSYTQQTNGNWVGTYAIQSNQVYTISIDVTNLSGYTNGYTVSFNTFDIVNTFHWMAVDYDFSTNNGTSTGGSAGNGWTSGLFIQNPIPTGDTNAPSINSSYDNNNWQIQTNSYYIYPTAFTPDPGFGITDPAGLGAVAQQSLDIYWVTNSTQDPTNSGTLVISNSIYRASSDAANYNNPLNGGDGVGSQIASDSFLLPEFVFARTNNASGSADPVICEFNIGYFYTNDWLNYTRIYPSGTFNVWGRLAAGAGAFNGCTLSIVTAGVGTSNQTTQVLGTFSDPAPAGWQVYHWIQLLDTNGNPVTIQLNGLATLRLTAPANAAPSGSGLNPLFFMLAPAVLNASSFSIAASVVSGNIQISIPTQANHNYTLWYSSSLTAPNWTQVGSAITGDGTVHVVPQSLSGANGFYRVVAQ